MATKERKLHMYLPRQIGWKARLAPCQFRLSACSYNTRNSKAKRKQRRGKQRKVTCSNFARNKTMQTTRGQKHHQGWPQSYLPSKLNSRARRGYVETYRNQPSWERTRVLREGATLDSKESSLRKAQSELDQQLTERKEEGKEDHHD